MTILASTENHLAEYEFGQLTIARRTDGHCIAFEGRRVAGEFRDCLKTHSPERVNRLPQNERRLATAL